MRRALVLLPILLLAPRLAAAQGQLTVTVADSANGAPLAAALVRLGTGARAETSLRGEARFGGVAAGAATVTVSRLGYETATVPVTVGPTGGTARVLLHISPVVLRRLSVTAEQLPRTPALRDFYIRKASWGSGYFLARRDFERDRTARFSTLLRRVPGSYVIEDGMNGQMRLRFNKSTASIADRDCPPVYYVDGNLYQLDSDDVDAEFPPNTIEGMEVYTGARIPPQFNGSRARCGVVVIWTRERAGDSSTR